MAKCIYGLSPITGTNDHWWDDEKAECTKCKQVLPHSGYHRLKGKARCGRSSTCKPCTSDIAFETRRRDIKKTTYRGYKYQMRAEGNDYDMTYEEFLEYWPTDNKCSMLGHELKYYPTEERGKWTGGRHYPNTPCVDHIDPREPLSKTNFQIISWRANELKADAIPEETELLFRHLEVSGHMYRTDSLMDIISSSAVETLKNKLIKNKWVGKYPDM